MAFWRRIKQSNLDASKLWNQITRRPHLHLHLHLHSPVSAKISGIYYPSLSSRPPQLDWPTNVRFFAAPVQFTQKKEEKDPTGPRLNDQITADVVRLVTDQGHSVVSRHEALKRARSLKLDLVEVQRNAKPPVCKLMEYQREKYKLELKEKDRAKKKSEVTLRKGACKEVRFTAKITQNDLQIKADTVKRLMENGYRVKCVAVGNMDKGEDSAALLSRFSALIEDIAITESETRVEEKDQAHVILRHVKYGPLKKGSGKKASKDKKAASSSVHEVESDDEILSEEKDEDVAEKEKAGWTIADANDDFDKLFDLKDNTDEVSKVLGSEKWSIGREPLSLSEGGSAHYEGSGRGDTLKSGSQLPNEVRRASLNMNLSPQRGEAGGKSRKPDQGTAPNIPSYGIFSSQRGNDAHGKQNIAAEVNRYKQRNASDTGRNSGPRRPMGNQNRPLSNPKVGREQAVNEGGEGKKFGGQDKVRR